MPCGGSRGGRVQSCQETPGAAPGAYSRHLREGAYIHVRFGPAGANGKGRAGTLRAGTRAGAVNSRGSRSSGADWWLQRGAAAAHRRTRELATYRRAGIVPIDIAEDGMSD
jgi:hypothetical protein